MACSWTVLALYISQYFKDFLSAAYNCHQTARNLHALTYIRSFQPLAGFEFWKLCKVNNFMRENITKSIKQRLIYSLRKFRSGLKVIK